MNNSRKKARIEEWNIVRHPRDGDWCLMGKVYKHATCTDGKLVFSSRIVEMNLVENRAETFYTTYELGQFSHKHSEKYEQVKAFYESYKRC